MAATKAVWWSRNASKIIIGVEVGRVMQTVRRKEGKALYQEEETGRVREKR